MNYGNQYCCTEVPKSDLRSAQPILHKMYKKYGHPGPSSNVFCVDFLPWQILAQGETTANNFLPDEQITKYKQPDLVTTQKQTLALSRGDWKIPWNVDKWVQ